VTTIVHLCELTCDECFSLFTPAIISVVLTPSKMAELMRAKAKAAGWDRFEKTRMHSLADYCPGCTEKLRSAQLRKSGPMVPMRGNKKPGAPR
jgi:hypothetical protein